MASRFYSVAIVLITGIVSFMGQPNFPVIMAQMHKIRIVKEKLSAI